MYRARGAQQLIVIDAREPEGKPGAIYEVPGDVLAAEPVHGVVSPVSTNGTDLRL